MIKINDIKIFRIHVKYLSARIAELPRHHVQRNMHMEGTPFPQWVLVSQSSDASMWWKRKHDSPDQAIVHCAVVQFWCSQARCWCFGQGAAWAARLACYVAPNALCVPIHLYQNLIEVLANLSFSSLTFGSDHAGHPSLPPCINELLYF